MGIRGIDALKPEERTYIRVLVTGSRDWSNVDEVYEAMASAEICWEHSDCGHVYVLVSGHCPTGADAIAEKLAKQRGWELELHPADWAKHDKRAGYIRNAEMVKLGADVCLAFIKNESKGATMTADLAQKAGINTIIYRENNGD